MPISNPGGTVAYFFVVFKKEYLPPLSVCPRPFREVLPLRVGG